MNDSTYSRLSVNDLAQTLKVLAEPSRLRIVCSLGLECRPVTDIIQATGLEQTNVSFHLRLLREAGLVRAERRGPFIYYCVPDRELLEILEHLDAWLNAKQHGADRGTMSADRREKRGKKATRAQVCPPRAKRTGSGLSKGAG